MSEEKTIETNKDIVEELLESGAHFGFSKSRRHPSVRDLILGRKNRVDIIDVRKTSEYLTKALAFVQTLAERNAQILFVASKPEAKRIVRELVEPLGIPFVTERWIGGTLTNSPEIRKRLSLLEDLSNKREHGELAKYTKRERLQIDRQIEKLELQFGGIRTLKGKPAAIFMIDAKHEHIAVVEAKKLAVPIISLSSSDNDISLVEYPIPANDSAVASIRYFTQKIVDTYKAHKGKPVE